MTSGRPSKFTSIRTQLCRSILSRLSSSSTSRTVVVLRSHLPGLTSHQGVSLKRWWPVIQYVRLPPHHTLPRGTEMLAKALVAGWLSIVVTLGCSNGSPSATKVSVNVGAAVPSGVDVDPSMCANNCRQSSSCERLRRRVLGLFSCRSCGFSRCLMCIK
jgi:hypothetical protein